ncbi:MAG: dihydrolipoyl dehydrogenase [Betaproteobacteria bacterium RIFCSPLOWO2_02_FULL_65_24]|nr:MAG: dihydrolipoyl dehydrogenase [Betaproteobacteria bacterium RIFCSPLOWO2_02_FULL_65_24]
MAQDYDVVVIGAGPAGYIGAIRCAQLGMKTACIEEWKNAKGEGALGGTCLNVGCIPSKALLESSEQYEHALKGLAGHGITVTGAQVDVARMIGRKDAIVARMTKGIESLFRKNRIDWLKGHGRFEGRGENEQGWRIRVGDTGAVTASNVIVATGSKARHLAGVPVDNQIVCDNVGALAFTDVPQRLGVVGAGVIGLELGSVWRRLGSKVTLLEALPDFLAAADEGVSKEAWKIFTREQGLDIQLAADIRKVTAVKKGVSVEYQHEGTAKKLEFDRLVVSIGRVPNTDALGAEEAGLRIDARGFIEVDEHCRSNLPNVFAIGDVVRGPMLAHKGEEEGVMVAELIAGQKPHIDYDTIPWVIYTSPEIAWVGRNEQQLKSDGTPYRTGQFPFSINGRALGHGDTHGFVKMLAHAKTDEILGVHVINTHASELISEAVVAMEFRASSEDIARIVHAHPSLSEVMHEAALAVDKRALNM